jgi:DNA polymerase-3 subunit gamma/tau
MTGDAPGPSQGPGPADQPRAAPAAPLALYRRYRPASFAELKGQDHVTEPLRQALRSGRVNHAYLFSGPRGCGKTSSARILARSLNCEQGPTPDPCGVCASCVALAPSGPGSIDVIEIDAASHGGVDDARDLRERAFYAPASSRYKIYIIDEAHMVTREGFNALLKLVEEPPPHLKFVFATTEPEKVIATIRSRTHHYPFRLVPPAVLRELLEQILAAEGVPFEPAVLPVVIRAGGGSVRDSLSVLDQLIAGSDESGLSYARAASLLGFTDDRLLDDVAQAFAARDGAAVFGAIDRVVEAGHDPRRFAADLLDRLRDLIVLAAVPDAPATGLLEIPADRVDGMRSQAGGFGQAELTRAAEVVSAGLIEMRGATSPRLLLELMCAQVLLPPPAAAGPAGGAGSGGDAALRARLDRLERRLDSMTQAGGIPAPAPVAPAPPVPVQPAAAPPAAAQAARAPAAAPPPEPAAPPRPAAPAPAAERPAAAPIRPQPAAPPPAASPAPASQPAAAPAGPVDTNQLIDRWPDILEAVRNERKVAWILLASATVQSLADNALTIGFPGEGNAKGFLSSGHDAVLSQVLRQMFGISPQVRAIARAPETTVAPPARGGGGAPASPPAGRSAPARPAEPRAADGSPAAASPTSRNDAPPWDGPASEWDDPRDDEDEYAEAAAVPAVPQPPPSGSGPGGRPGPAGPGGALTGMDLIERELGGRVIEDPGLA